MRAVQFDQRLRLASDSPQRVPQELPAPGRVAR